MFLSALLVIFMGLAVSWLIYERTAFVKENRVMLKDLKNIRKKNIELESKITECQNKLNYN